VKNNDAIEKNEKKIIKNSYSFLTNILYIPNTTRNKGINKIGKNK
jgi:hypothetical protein